MRAFNYVWSLSISWRRRRSRQSISRNLKSHAARKLQGCMCYGNGVITDRKVFNWGNMDFWPFLFLWPWPWFDDLDLHTPSWPYSLEMYRICETKLSTSGLSKVIVSQTDIQTDALKIIYHAASWVVNKTIASYRPTSTLCFLFRFTHKVLFATDWIFSWASKTPFKVKCIW